MKWVLNRLIIVMQAVVDLQDRGASPSSVKQALCSLLGLTADAVSKISISFFRHSRKGASSQLLQASKSFIVFVYRQS